MIRKIIQKYYNWRYPKTYIDSSIILDESASNVYLRDAINMNKRIMIARFGTSETSGFWQSVVCEKLPFLRFPKQDELLLRRNAGMFSTNRYGRHIFVKRMKKAIKEIDILCVMFAKEERIIIDKYNKKKVIYLDKKIVHAENFLNYHNPWISSLENKKVLVVSPFAYLMEEQYKQRELLFNNGFSLPKFTFIPLEAPLTQNGENNTFRSWNQAFKFMANKIKKIDFDIALLGCGSYGLPLQGVIYKMEKASVYVGGALSPLFGIYGRRWEGMPFINQHWRRPPKKYKPKCANEIEDGCYW